MADKGPRINEEIPAGDVRLISSDGEQLGIMDVDAAQAKADKAGLDLVEISPNANPAVCKIMDFGKYKYEQAQKAKAAKKKQQRIEVKEMKFRPKIDTGDYETKKGHVLRFLKKGARVKVTIMFRGREMAHPEEGARILERLSKDLEEYATIDAQPKLEGRNMHMVFAPIKGAFAKDKKNKKEDTDAKNENA